MGMVALLAVLSGIVGGAIFSGIRRGKPESVDVRAREGIRILVDAFHGEVNFNCSRYLSDRKETQLFIPTQWLPEDLEDLDRKFDALCEHLGVEFVQEKVSDGSEWADREGWICRKRKNRPNPPNN